MTCVTSSLSARLGTDRASGRCLAVWCPTKKTVEPGLLGTGPAYGLATVMTLMSLSQYD